MTGRYRPAGGGNETPSGTFKPFHMEIDHYSKEWDNAPMPYSIFFTRVATPFTALTSSGVSVVRCRTAAFGYRGIGRASFARLHGLDPHAS